MNILQNNALSFKQFIIRPPKFSEDVLVCTGYVENCLHLKIARQDVSLL